MKIKMDTENIIFGALVAMFVVITAVMGFLLYDTPPHPEAKTLKTLCPSTVESLGIMARIKEAYEKLHPEIRLEVSTFPYRNIEDKLRFMMVAGMPPDVCGISQPQLQRFINLGVVEPLDDWIRNDPEFDPEAFFPQCMDDANWDGIQYGIPQVFSTVCLWYNKDLFRKAGVPFPTRDWTKEDLVDAAGKLTADSDGDGIPDQWGFQTDNSHWNRFPCWVWMDGAEFFSEDGLHSTFDDPAVVAGIQWLVDLSLKQKVMPGWSHLKNVRGRNLFLSGKLAMATETRYFMPEFTFEKNKDKIVKFDWDVCELPHGARRATTFVMENRMIPRHLPEERKRMGWDFIKFLASEPGQRLLADMNTSIPARRTIAEELVTHPGVPPENDHAFIDALEYMRYLHWRYPMEPVFYQVHSNLMSVWMGLAEPEPVCRQAAHDLNKALADYMKIHPDEHIPVKTRWVPFDKRPAAAPVAAN